MTDLEHEMEFPIIQTFTDRLTRLNGQEKS